MGHDQDRELRKLREASHEAWDAATNAGKQFPKSGTWDGKNGNGSSPKPLPRMTPTSKS